MVIEFSKLTFLILTLYYLACVFFTSMKTGIPIEYKKEFINLCVYLSILFIISLTLFPLDLNSLFDDFQIYNLIPFKVIIDLFTNQSLSESFYNIVGNIVLFIPFGFFMYIKSNKNKKKTLAAVFIMTLSIEMIQAFMPTRFCEIDDIILNVLGGYIGLSIVKDLQTNLYIKANK